MTAEVGVLNRVGVALAADSAVTVGIRARKIWTSAEKLFQLSPTAPVGVMVHGNADFVGVPWETIVKSYRSQLGNTRFDTLEEYCLGFLSFLVGQEDLFPSSRQDARSAELIFVFYFTLRDRLERILDRAAEERDGLDESDITELVDSFFKDYSGYIRQFKRLNDLEAIHVKQARSYYSKAVRDIKKELFGQLPMSSGTSRRITSLATQMLTREFFGPAQSGLVFAGFGEKECYPSIFSYDLEEMVLGMPRVKEGKRSVIDDNNLGTVLPFAQQEMVYAFMEGIDPKLEEIMIASTAALFDGSINELLKALGIESSEVAAEIRTSMDKALADLFRAWQRERVSHWGPVLQIVSSLPKDELGAMAESLVNLTRFRRKVTAVPETVAGPIDVAVITKGDGFVWIRRKHYFDPSVNPRALLRYKKEVES